MPINDLRYWSEIEELANVIMELTQSTMKPIMDEFYETYEVDELELSPEDITAICRENYTEEQNELWDDVERIACNIVSAYDTNHDQVSVDIWSFIITPNPSSSNIRPH